MSEKEKTCQTRWLKTNEISMNEYRKALEDAASLLRDGELVAFPTETVYGLGGNALDAEAAAKIYSAKGRPSDNPLIVHISYIDMLEPLVEEIPSVCRRLAFEFWPGPLTMILPKSDQVPMATTGGLDTVAVRMPAHGVALDLIDTCGLPLAAPSANRSGKPSPTRGEHVYHDLQGRIPMVLDAGAVEIGLESTIIDLSRPEPVILRPGKITYDDLKPFVPRLKEYHHPSEREIERPKAPGMKYTHYAPEGTMIMLPLHVEDDFFRALESKEKTAILASTEKIARWRRFCPDVTWIALGAEDDLDSLAHNLFHALRQCDLLDMETIYIESFSEDGLGEALMNRIRKASSCPLLIEKQ